MTQSVNHSVYPVPGSTWELNSSYGGNLNSIFCIVAIWEITIPYRVNMGELNQSLSVTPWGKKIYIVSCIDGGGELQLLLPRRIHSCLAQEITAGSNK